MVVAVFDDADHAHLGIAALSDLHAEGSLSVYSAALITVDERGRIGSESVVHEAPESCLRAATTSLLGLLGAPVDSAASLSSVGVGADFLDEACTFLLPGKVAVVAEIDEDWALPLETRLAPLGPVILRRPRIELVDADIAHDVAVFKYDLAMLRRDYGRGSGVTASIEANLRAVYANLEAAHARARARREALDRERETKIECLHRQAAGLAGEMRARVERRMREVRADYTDRADKLTTAGNLAREVLAA
jgi:hypothetical protein